MIYDARLSLVDSQIERIVAKLTSINLTPKAVVRENGRVVMILDIDNESTGVWVQLNRPAGCIICSQCKSMHFKPEANKAEPFVCMCGKTLNKK